VESRAGGGVRQEPIGEMLFGGLLSFLIDHRFGNPGQRGVGCLLFFQRLFEQRHRLVQTQLARPRPQGAVPRDFVVLDRLRRGQKPGVESGRAPIFVHDVPSSVMPTIAAQVFACGFLSIMANTCSRRST
jgi:hypothetical protein